MVPKLARTTAWIVAAGSVPIRCLGLTSLRTPASASRGAEESGARAETEAGSPGPRPPEPAVEVLGESATGLGPQAPSNDTRTTGKLRMRSRWYSVLATSATHSGRAPSLPRVRRARDL